MTSNAQSRKHGSQERARNSTRALSAASRERARVGLPRPSNATRRRARNSTPATPDSFAVTVTGAILPCDRYDPGYGDVLVTA